MVEQISLLRQSMLSSQPIFQKIDEHAKLQHCSHYILVKLTQLSEYSLLRVSVRLRVYLMEVDVLCMNS